jgi:hypothetical protein
MFIAKLKVDVWQTIASALLVCSIFACHSSPATSATAATAGTTLLKHYDNPVVRKIKCPKDYAIGTLHVVSADMASGHELDDPQHFRVTARGDITVTVPEGQMLLLEVNGSVVKHPHCLRDFSAPVIECLRSASIFSMDDNVEQSIEDVFLEDLPRLQGLERINLDRSDVTDKGIAYIKNMPRLNAVDIYECGVLKGDTINALSTCPNIQFINMGDCSTFKATNYAALSKLPKLEDFQAMNSRINDESLKYLSHTKSLRKLDLRGNKSVTDEGLRSLMSLKMLDRLSLEGTSVTAAGVKSLAPLKIKVINIPKELAKSPADLADLKKALPGTSISILNKGNKQIGEINGWFSGR